jgi:CRP-like cAMP-binding protein
MYTARLLDNINRQIKLTTEETSFFGSLVKVKELSPGEFLLKEGEVCRYISYVLEGSLKTYQTDDLGREHITDFLVEDWWADDLYSFLTGTASTYSIRAIEPTRVARLSNKDLETLYKEVPTFERYFRILFQNAYIAQKKQLNAMLSATAAERYKSFLQNKPYALRRFHQKDIASYLGVTPQFLSTLKRKMH